MCMEKFNKTDDEIINSYIEQYEVLRLMFKYACNYVHEHDVNNKERVLNTFVAYFSKRKRKIDNKCRKKFDTSLLGIILEHRPDLLENNESNSEN